MLFHSPDTPRGATPPTKHSLSDKEIVILNPLYDDPFIETINKLYGITDLYDKYEVPVLYEIPSSGEDEVTIFNPLYIEKENILTILPEELLLKIVSHFDDPRDLLNLELVNTVTFCWMNCTEAINVYMWKKLCQIHWNMKNQRLLPGSRSAKILKDLRFGWNWKSVFKHYYHLNKILQNDCYSSGESKVVLIGDSGVGKSSLTIRFVKGTFIHWDPTKQDSHKKRIILDADICTVDILDTAHLYYSTMFDYYVRTGQGFIIVFSVTDKASFDAVSVYHEMLLRSQEDGEEEDLPILLVGNKCDQAQQRVVTTKQGQWLAKKLGCRYMETSAKENLNVQEIFFEIVRMIERNPPGASLLESPFTEEWGNVKRKKCRIM